MLLWSSNQIVWNGAIAKLEQILTDRSDPQKSAEPKLSSIGKSLKIPPIITVSAS